MIIQKGGWQKRLRDFGVVNELLCTRFWNPTASNYYDNLLPSLLNNIRLSGHKVSPCHLNLSKKNYMTSSAICCLGGGGRSFMFSPLHHVKIQGASIQAVPGSSGLCGFLKLSFCLPQKDLFSPHHLCSSGSKISLALSVAAIPSQSINFTLALRGGETVLPPLLSRSVHVDSAPSQALPLRDLSWALIVLAFLSISRQSAYF